MRNKLFKVFSISFVVLISSFLVNAQTCRENLAEESEQAVCAMEIVSFPKIKTSEITGIVLYNFEPFQNAIVELYKVSKDKTELVKKVKTLKDGRFCFGNIPKGLYKIKLASADFAYKCTEVEVEIRGKVKRLISLPIEIGH